MRLIEKSDRGFIVHISDYEMENLTKQRVTLWNYKDLIGKDIDISSFREAVLMAENVNWARRKILENIKELENKVLALPLDQFTSKGAQ